ncbi:MAG TPA: hypothetical protein VF538_08260 [Pyrinomonadaceae bacterium]|jgi:hypothetical protein
MEKVSLIKLLGLPEAFGGTLIAFFFILLLSPYFSGADFGILKVPAFTDLAKKWLRLIAPILFASSVFIYLPIFPKEQNENTVLNIQRPQFSNPPRVTEQQTWKVFELWASHHPEIIREYGPPKEVKFISLHEQQFTHGHVIYNVTDGWSAWLFDQDEEFKKLKNPHSHLTPGDGRKVDEEVFAEAAKGMNEAQRKFYRSLVDKRVKSSDFKGIGIIGGIGILYIQNRFYDVLGLPLNNEYLVIDAVYAANDGYEVLCGLRHDNGETGPNAPKVTYVLYEKGRHYDRHVEFPVPFRDR